MSTDKSRYFDWAATSPADEDILREAADTALSCWANPSSAHGPGKNARAAFEEARKRAADALQVPPDTVFFTSGGTESDQIPLLSVLSKPQKGRVLISSIEHPAVREQALLLKKCGWAVEQLTADRLGVITAQTVVSSLTPDTALVCIMAVNNETGIIQPVKEIALAVEGWAAEAGKRRPKIHIDCVQAAGKIPLCLNELGIDSAAFSAHKLCGPRGIGILYLKDGKNALEPFLKGGGQEQGIRSGTENLLGAVAFSKCLERYFFTQETPEFLAQKRITASLIDRLSSLPGCTIIPPGRTQSRDMFSPYVLQVAFSGIPGNVMLRALDARGFYISTGSACSTKKASRPVLDAMHISRDLSGNAVRLSFGPHTTEQAVDELFDAISSITRAFN